MPESKPPPRSLRWLAAGALALTLALPLAASAQEAYTRGVLNLRAGPGTDYPVVVQLAAGQPLNVIGCTTGYAWCDVVLPDGLRGWVVASRLDYAWGSDVVPLVSYGAMIGVPIIGFTLGSYWSDHYRNRPWFREPRWWGHRPPPPPMPGWRPAPPPPIGWHPRPPRPGWQPPGGPPPRPGWQGPDRPRPGWRPPDRPHRPGVAPPAARPPGWEGRPGRPGRPEGPGSRPGPGPRPPQWNGPPPGAGRPMPPPRPMPAPRGSATPSAGQNTPLGDRP